MAQSGGRRASAANNHRLQRESQRRRRDLERQAKEIAKLSVLEQARLEVETFENSLDVLLSIHKEPHEQWDWIALVAALKPPAPRLEATFEVRALHEALANYPRDAQKTEDVLQLARASDNQTYRAALEDHEVNVAQIDSLRHLASRILDGESLAFLEAFVQFNPVAEFSSAGSLRQFAMERSDLIDCVFKVDFDGTIPNDVKSLAANGKLSIKPMPKARRHELYQDYVGACALRMAGEVFAMLPIETIIVTALADVIANPPEKPNEVPILSVVFDRPGLARIDFEVVSPTEVIDQFQSRCNFKVTRGSGQFQPITPLSVNEVGTPAGQRPGFDRLLALVKEFQDEIRPAATSALAKAISNGDTV